MKPDQILRLSHVIVQFIYAGFAVLLLIIALLVIRSVVIDLYVTPETDNSYGSVQCADAIHEVKQLFFDLFEDEDITLAELDRWQEKWKEYRPEILHLCKDTQLNYLELVGKFERYRHKTQKKIDDVYLTYRKAVIEIKNTPIR